MTLITVKVSKRYQIAVPAAAREQLKIHSGDQLLVDIQDGMILLLPKPQNYARSLLGLHKEVWEGGKVSDYLNGEREEWSGLTNG